MAQQAGTWCEACQKTHESREECSKGWVRSFWTGDFISPEQLKEEVENFKKFMEENEDEEDVKECVFCHKDVDVSKTENFEHLDDGEICCSPCYATESDTGE